MSEQVKDGGPAFPMAYNEGTSSCSPQGMSLRDWLAGKALPALLDKTSYDDMKKFTQEELREALAVGAYQLADAMLKERSKAQ